MPIGKPPRKTEIRFCVFIRAAFALIFFSELVIIAFLAKLANIN